MTQISWRTMRHIHLIPVSAVSSILSMKWMRSACNCSSTSSLIRSISPHPFYTSTIHIIQETSRIPCSVLYACSCFHLQFLCFYSPIFSNSYMYKMYQYIIFNCEINLLVNNYSIQFIPNIYIYIMCTSDSVHVTVTIAPHRHTCTCTAAASRLQRQISLIYSQAGASYGYSKCR